MADPGIQAFLLLCFKIFAAVACAAVVLALPLKLYDKIRWDNFAAKRSADERQKLQDENWRLRHN